MFHVQQNIDMQLHIIPVNTIDAVYVNGSAKVQTRKLGLTLI